MSSRPRAYSAGRGGKELAIVSVLELLIESQLGSSEPKRVFDKMSGVSKDKDREEVVRVKRYPDVERVAG